MSDEPALEHGDSEPALEHGGSEPALAYLLDMNVISEGLKPSPNANVMRWMQSTPSSRMYLPVITIGEIVRGITKREGTKRGTELRHWLENGLMIFYILSATLILAKVVSGMIKIKAAGTDAIIPSSSIISNIIIIIIYCIGLLIILQSQGISITPVLTALGVGGLAVALALQPTLSNLFAGLQLISSGNFNRGDFVKLTTGEDGFIEDITWRSTTIRAAADHIIIVPNSKLADMTVSNYYLPQHEITFAVEIGISYDSDLATVEKITKEVIKETLQESPEGVAAFEPETRFSAFGESNIRLKAFLRVNNYSAQFEVRSEFIKKLHERYNKEGIIIPYPMRTVLLKNNDKE